MVLHVLWKRIRERDGRLRLRAVAHAAPRGGNHGVVGHLLAARENGLEGGRFREEVGIILPLVEMHLHRLFIDLNDRIRRFAGKGGTTFEGGVHRLDRGHAVEQSHRQRSERRTAVEDIRDGRRLGDRREEPFGQRLERRATLECRRQIGNPCETFEQIGRERRE